MAITSFIKPIQPTKPKIAYIDQAAASVIGSANTWYTVVDITSGTGCISRIISTVYNSQYYANTNLEIRVTADTIQNTLTTGVSTLLNGNYMRGNDFNSGVSGNAVPNAPYNFEYLQPIYFKQSAKVEFRFTSPANGYLTGYVDYVLV